MSDFNDMKMSAINKLDDSSEVIRAKIQTLRVRAALAKMEVRDKYDQSLNHLESQYGEFKQTLKHAREQAPEDWDETKSRLSSVWQEIQAGCGKIEDAILGREPKS